jgi:hypothetical protein
MEDKEIRTRIEKEFELYRIVKALITIEEEKIKNQNGDPSIELQEWKTFCQFIEYAVNHLPDIEKSIVFARYMDKNSEYIFDREIYGALHMSPALFNHVRKRVLKKLAFLLGFKGIEKKSSWVFNNVGSCKICQ